MGVGARSAAVPIIARPRIVKAIVATPATPSDGNGPNVGQEYREQERACGAVSVDTPSGSRRRDHGLIGHEALEDRRRDDVDDQRAGCEDSDRDERDRQRRRRAEGDRADPGDDGADEERSSRDVVADSALGADPADQPAEQPDRGVQIAVACSPASGHRSRMT